MLNVFENMLAAENHKKFRVFDEKKIFQVNALKVGATSNIKEELQKKIQKNQRLKKCWTFWEYSRPGK